MRGRLRRWSMSHKTIVTSRALTATITSGRALIPCPRLNNIEDANGTVDSMGRRLPVRATYRRARFPDGYGVHLVFISSFAGRCPQRGRSLRTGRWLPGGPLANPIEAKVILAVTQRWAMPRQT